MCSCISFKCRLLSKHHKMRSPFNNDLFRCYGDQINEDEMDGACSTRGRYDKFIQDFYLQT